MNVSFGSGQARVAASGLRRLVEFVQLRTAAFDARRRSGGVVGALRSMALLLLMGTSPTPDASGAVLVRVFDEAGNAVGAAEVGWVGSPATGLTGPDGVVKLQRRGDEAAEIWVQHPRFLFASKSLPKGVQTLDVLLAVAAEIEGTVRREDGSAAAGVAIRTVGGEAVSDPNGAFLLTGVREGEQRLVCASPGLVCDENSVDARPGVRRRVDLVAYELVSELKLSVIPSGWDSLTLQVWLERDGKLPQTGASYRADKSIVLQVPAGSWTLVVKADDSRRFSEHREVLKIEPRTTMARTIRLKRAR